MVWRAAFGGVLIAASLLLPLAAAAPVQGSFTIESGAAFPAGTSLGLTSAIVFAPPATHPLPLSGTAAAVHVRIYEQRILGPGGLVDVERSVTLSTWDLTGVSISVAGGPTRAPTLAIEASPGASVVFQPAEAVEVAHRTETTLASAVRVQSSGPAPHHNYYERRVLGDHLHAKAYGAVEVVGRGMLRIQDLDLVLDADQNRTELWTGEREVSKTERVHRWAFLDFEGAALHLTSPGTPLEVVGTESPALAWRGVAHVVATEGMLVGPQVVYGGHGAARLDGDFEATLRPTPGASTMRLGAIRGDLRETTLEAYGQAAPAPAGGVPSAFLLAALLVGTVVVSTGTAAGVLALRERRAARRPAAAPLDPYQHCLDYADFFEREDDPGAALECLRTARAFAEEDEYGVVLWEATCCERLGNLEDALERYEAAIVLAPKGDAEAAFGAAMVAGQLDLPEAALTDLRLALMADPALLDTLDDFEPDEDPFRDLRASPDFKRLRRDARGWARTLEEE